MASGSGVVELESGSPDETERIGAGLAERLHAGDLLVLEGELATGKTVLVRGLLAALGGDAGEVRSPSFVLVYTYECHRGAIRRLHHVDLYRLADDERALREIGLEELLSDPEAVVAVEWPRSTLLTWLPEGSRLWRVQLDLLDDVKRRVEITEPG